MKKTTYQAQPDGTVKEVKEVKKPKDPKPFSKMSEKEFDRVVREYRRQSSW